MKARIFNLIYSLAAAVVIFGAWQKLEHARHADLFLTIGLLTECAIFTLYGLQELFKPVTREDRSEGPVTDVSDVVRLLSDQNAILRDVYKTSK